MGGGEGTGGTRVHPVHQAVFSGRDTHPSTLVRNLFVFPVVTPAAGEQLLQLLVTECCRRYGAQCRVCMGEGLWHFVEC